MYVIEAWSVYGMIPNVTPRAIESVYLMVREAGCGSAVLTFVYDCVSPPLRDFNSAIRKACWKTAARKVLSAVAVLT